ncbi:MAG: OmpP1/FadL family transporter [Steroidobacteraceae bacterium]
MRSTSFRYSFGIASFLAFGHGAAVAGGFAITAQSASALGNAFAGTAEADDASVVWFNPAGMTRLSGTNVVSSASLVRTSFKFENTASSGAFAAPGAGDGGDGGSTALVPQLFASAHIAPDWSLGLAFNTPFGLKTEYPAGWRGQLTALKSEARSYNLDPSLAYRISDRLSVGAGVDWQRFTADLTNAAGPLGVAQLKASDSAWGFNLGALYSLSDSTRISAAYRSSFAYSLHGTARFSQGNGLFDSSIRAHLSVPENASLSVFSALSNRLELMMGGVWTRWSRLAALSVIRTSGSALGANGSTVSVLPFAWKNTVTLSVGANYNVTPDWKVRIGFASDPAVSTTAERTPRLPDERRFTLSIGTRLRVRARSTIEVAYAHDFVRNAAINDTIAGVPGALVGHFDVAADVLSAQYNYELK